MIVSSGVAVPLFVITQLIASPAWAVKLIGTVVMPVTLVPTGLELVQDTVFK